MRFLIWSVLACWNLVVAGCAPSVNTDISDIGLIMHTGVTVTVTPPTQDSPSGLWLAEYVFAAPQSAMLFSRSLGDYRMGTWKSNDPNVTLERLNGFDAMLFAAPSITASFVFTPYSQAIGRDYTPFISFTDGGMAMFTGQFDLMPAKDRGAIAALEGDIGNWHGDQPHLGVRLQSNDMMIKDGVIMKGIVTDISFGGGTYIFVGDAQITQGQDFAGVIDPGLPAWLSERFDEDLSRIFDGYRALWHEGLPKKSTILFAFHGYKDSGFNNKGGVVNTVLTLEVSGQKLRKESPEILQNIQWFFAHETAHLFQGRKGVALNGAPWIHEGSANAMANNVIFQQGLVDQAFIDAEYAKAFKVCVTQINKNAFADYECGDLIAQITDGALPDHTLFEFWNVLTDPADGRGAYKTEDYFAIMSELGADIEIINGLRVLTSGNVQNPDGVLKKLMVKTNLYPKFDAAGALVSLTLP